MKKNIGIEDRIIRFVLFDGLLGVTLAGFELSAGWNTAIFIASLYILMTLIFGYSPLYHLFNWNTRFSTQNNTSSL